MWAAAVTERHVLRRLQPRASVVAEGWIRNEGNLAMGSRHGPGAPEFMRAVLFCMFLHINGHQYLSGA